MDSAVLLLLAIVYYAFPMVLIGGIAWALFKRTSIAKAILAQASDREVVERWRAP